MAKPAGPLGPRFWSKVEITTPDSCWFWKASIDVNGYGQFGLAPGQCGCKRWTMAKAHRVSWLLTQGDIPPGMFLCHKCDMPRCVNPSHLFLGTQSDNMRDCVEKDRHGFGRVGQPIYFNIDRIKKIIAAYQAGIRVRLICERHEISRTHLLRILKRHKIQFRDRTMSFRKLTDPEVRQIRELYALGNVSQQALGARFGVSAANIGLIVRGTNWRALGGTLTPKRKQPGPYGYKGRPQA